VTLRDERDAMALPPLADGLSRTDPAQARFLATMSHELRTPLNVVIAYSEALQADPAMADVQVAEYATAINDAGRQLLALVDVILDVARVESGHVELPSDLIDIERLVLSRTADLSASAHNGQLALTSDVPADLPLLRGDERRLGDALRHLIANAVKFTLPGGAIRVAVRLDKNRGDLLLLVSDTGIGIAPGDLDRVFRPFTQLDASLDRRFPGSGLGLYVSQITARAHGGDLVLRSDVGVGTTAILRLPANRLVDTPPVPQTPPPKDPP
jgi:signal transduction histidine kinase